MAARRMLRGSAAIAPAALTGQGDDPLLTPREAEFLIGRRYGWLEQGRRMLAYIQREHPDEPDALARWTAATPAWEKVGNAVRYRRSAVLPFATARAGDNRHGRCGDCSFFRHGSWEKDSAWFDPNRAYCMWLKDRLKVERDAPGWVDSAIKARVSASSGLTCRGFDPKTSPLTSQSSG